MQPIGFHDSNLRDECSEATVGVRGTQPRGSSRRCFWVGLEGAARDPGRSARRHESNAVKGSARGLTPAFENHTIDISVEGEATGGNDITYFDRM